MYINVVSAFEFSNMLSQLLFLETLPWNQVLNIKQIDILVDE